MAPKAPRRKPEHQFLMALEGGESLSHAIRGVVGLMLQSVELDASQQTLRLLEASGLLGTETERLRAGEVRKRPVGQLAKQLALQAFSRFTAGRG